MGIWLILGAMTALAVGLALYPLLRRPSVTASRHEHNLAVYRAQLEELREERERGLIGGREAAAAELEIKRRMLAADSDERARGRPTPPAAGRRLALLVAVGLPLLSLAVYWQLGSPDQPAAPFAEREAMRPQLAQGQTGATVPPVETMLARLEERVESAPDDLEAWMRLGQAYGLLERHGDAASAYRQALALREDVPALHAALGEALIMAAGGTVTEPARGALERALALDPAEPRARFYQGLALAQRGQQQDALDTWLALLESSPPDAPWVEALRFHIGNVAQALGRDPEQVLAQAGRPAVAANGASAAEGPLERHARALRLETALEGDPKDWQGWIELARLWAAQGDPERARRALDRGGEAYAGAPFVEQQFRQVAAELGLAGDAPRPPGPTAEQVEAAQAMSAEEQGEMIRGMVEGLAARLEQAPDDPQGWRMLGRSYLVLNEPEKSAEAYAQLAALMPRDLDAQLEYAQALLALGDQDAPLAPALVEQMERVLALDGEDPAALFYLGRAAEERGEPAAAVAYWQRLLALLPPGSPDRAQIQALIEQVGPGE